MSLTSFPVSQSHFTRLNTFPLRFAPLKKSYPLHSNPWIRIFILPRCKCFTRHGGLLKLNNTRLNVLKYVTLIFLHPLFFAPFLISFFFPIFFRFTGFSNVFFCGNLFLMRISNICRQYSIKFLGVSVRRRKLDDIRFEKQTLTSS